MFENSIYKKLKNTMHLLAIRRPTGITHCWSKLAIEVLNSAAQYVG
jgi:hypothetical protein